MSPEFSSFDKFLESMPFGNPDDQGVKAWIFQAQKNIDSPFKLITFNQKLRSKLLTTDGFADINIHRSLANTLMTGFGDCRTAASTSYVFAKNFSQEVFLMDLQLGQLRRGGHCVCVFKTSDGFGVAGINKIDNQLPSVQYSDYHQIATTLSRHYLVNDRQVWQVYSLRISLPLTDNSILLSHNNIENRFITATSKDI